MKIGVISDTHNFFDPKIPELFNGVDHILHAGDVGTAVIRFQLEEIAPLTAVFGNTDSSGELKLTESVTLDGRRFLLQHIVEPRELGDDLKVRIARERPDVVVFGHTHRAFCQIMGGVFFSIRVTRANPASAWTAASRSCNGTTRESGRNSCRSDSVTEGIWTELTELTE
jgi:putative phosphoesterase